MFRLKQDSQIVLRIRGCEIRYTELEPIYLLFGVRSSLHIDCSSKISSHDADAAKYRSVCCCSLKADT